VRTSSWMARKSSSRSSRKPSVLRRRCSWGYVATHVEDLSEEEVAKRAQDLAAQS
jgi:hypothetical protein